MKRLFALVAAVAMILAVAPGAMAHETNPSIAQLEKAGWNCFDPDNGGPLGIHCMPPNSGNGRAVNVMVFEAGTGHFAGTELLRFTDKDLSNLPCPKQHGGTWEWIGFAWACHHWKGAPG